MSLVPHTFKVMELLMKVGLFTIPLAFATCIAQSAWTAKGPLVTKTPAPCLVLSAGTSLSRWGLSRHVAEETHVLSDVTMVRSGPT